MQAYKNLINYINAGLAVAALVVTTLGLNNLAYAKYDYFNGRDNHQVMPVLLDKEWNKPPEPEPPEPEPPGPPEPQPSFEPAPIFPAEVCTEFLPSEPAPISPVGPPISLAILPPASLSLSAKPELEVMGVLGGVTVPFGEGSTPMGPLSFDYLLNQELPAVDIWLQEGVKAAWDEVNQATDGRLNQGLSAVDSWVREGAKFVWNNVSQATVDMLVNVALYGEISETRILAINALGKIGGLKAAWALINIVSGEKDSSVRIAAINGLGKIKDPAAIPTLINALGDKDIFVSVAARGALVEIGVPAVEPLIGALSNEKSRFFAEEALVGIGWPAVGALTKALNSGDPLRDKSVKNVLGRINKLDKAAASADILDDAIKDNGLQAAIGQTKDSTVTFSRETTVKVNSLECVEKPAITPPENINFSGQARALAESLSIDDKDIEILLATLFQARAVSQNDVDNFTNLIFSVQKGDKAATLTLLNMATGEKYSPKIRPILIEVAINALGISEEASAFAKELSAVFKELNPKTQMDERNWENAAKFSLLYAMKIDLLAEDGHYWKVAKEDVGVATVENGIKEGRIKEWASLDRNSVAALRNSQISSVNIMHILAIGFFESTERFHNLEDGMRASGIHNLLNAHSGRGFLWGASQIGAEAAKISQDPESEQFIYSVRIIQGMYRNGQELDLISMGDGREVFAYWNYAMRSTLPKYEAFYGAIEKFSGANPKFNFLNGNIIRNPKK